MKNMSPPPGLSGFESPTNRNIVDRLDLHPYAKRAVKVKFDWLTQGERDGSGDCSQGKPQYAGRPQSSMLRHTFIPIKTRSAWFPLYSVTAKAPSFLQIRHLVRTTSGRRHLGVIIVRLQCDRIRKAREGNAPADPYASKGHKGDNTRVTKVIDTKVRVAYTAISAGNTVVADLPDRGRQPADINPMHVAWDEGAQATQVRCIPHSRREASCSSPWLA